MIYNRRIGKKNSKIKCNEFLSFGSLGWRVRPQTISMEDQANCLYAHFNLRTMLSLYFTICKFISITVGLSSP